MGGARVNNLYLTDVLFDWKFLFENFLVTISVQKLYEMLKSTLCIITKILFIIIKIKRKKTIFFLVVFLFPVIGTVSETVSEKKERKKYRKEERESKNELER